VRACALQLADLRLPELVTHSLPQYEAVARRLLQPPRAELAALRARLARARLTASVFDTDHMVFCRRCQAHESG
jgi:hypothetical protein